MTKKELLEALEQFDDDAVIKIQDFCGTDSGEPFDIEGIEDCTHQKESYVLLV